MTGSWAIALTVLSIVVGTASGQEKKSAFVVDPSKPYVYIAFDHVGPRTPVTSGEEREGLWLRLVNNCGIPIEVRAHDLGTGDPGVAIDYDVVSVGGILDTPPPIGKPRGYSSHVGSPAVIKPGADLLFSVPRNHVTRWWYLQSRFDIVLPTPRSGVQPFSIVSFFLEGIPEKYRPPAPK